MMTVNNYLIKLIKNMGVDAVIDKVKDLANEIESDKSFEMPLNYEKVNSYNLNKLKYFGDYIKCSYNDLVNIFGLQNCEYCNNPNYGDITWVIKETLNDDVFAISADNMESENDILDNNKIIWNIFSDKQFNSDFIAKNLKKFGLKNYKDRYHRN